MTHVASQSVSQFASHSQSVSLFVPLLAPSHSLTVDRGEANRQTCWCTFDDADDADDVDRLQKKAADEADDEDDFILLPLALCLLALPFSGTEIVIVAIDSETETEMEELAVLWQSLELCVCCHGSYQPKWWCTSVSVYSGRRVEELSSGQRIKH